MRRAAILVLAGAAGCVDHLPPLDETTSLKVELLAPADPGSAMNRLSGLASAQIKVTAIDAQDQPDTTVNRTLQVYVQFLGTLTPELGSGTPLATVTMQNGVSGTTTVNLPPLYGPSVIWVEDGGDGGSYATGTAPTLWFPDPYIHDISAPTSETALDALVSSPLDNKQVTVSGSRHGANGHMVVTSTYAQGYTLSDVQCADPAGTPPCTAGDYDHLLIFSFSRPKDDRGRTLQPGQFVDGFAGGVEEFNGLTEIGFPQTFVKSDQVSVDPARIPAPVVIQQSWLSNPILFERVEAGLVEVDGATVCALDSDWDTYKQWKLDIGAGCGAAINVVTAGVVEFDPATKVGMVMPKVVGIMRQLNLSNGNIWIMYPRSSADLGL